MYSEQKKQEIRNLYSNLNSVRKTAKEAQVSKNTITNIINNNSNKFGKPMGRPKLLNSADKLRIKRYLMDQIGQNKIVNSRTIKEELDLGVSISTITRELKSMGFYYDFIDKILPLN